MADDDHQDDADNLLSVSFGEPGILPKKQDYGGCRHTNVLVDERLRVVECRACKTQLDAVQVLLEIAAGERRLWWALEGLKRTRAELSSQIERLTKTKHNLQRQLQRLRKRTNP